MTSSLSGRTALVTGSTSGIGAAVARTLAAHGAHVVVSGRDTARGQEVAAGIRAGGGLADVLTVDLSAPAARVRAFADRVVEVLGTVPDVLVANAALYPVGPTADLADDDLDAMLAVNVRAPHVLVGHLAPAMAARGSGSVVVLGSWMARVGTSGAAMYSATKAAAEHLTRCWAAEYGPAGVRVNAVAPGVTLTPGNAAFRAVLDAMTAGTPAGGVLSPDDVAAGVLWLVSDAAAGVHGTVLDVDGGISATRAA
jgi:3-oxoacyl-[acyl-carrier protein] reductase